MTEEEFTDHVKSIFPNLTFSFDNREFSRTGLIKVFIKNYSEYDGAQIELAIDEYRKHNVPAIWRFEIIFVSKRDEGNL